MADKNKPQNWGWAYIESRYFEKIDSLASATRRTYTIIALIVSAALLAAGSLITMPNIALSLLGLPVAGVFYLIIITLRRNYNTKNDKIPFRERFSFRARKKYSLVFGILSLIVIVYLGTIVPYVVGGTLLATGALIFYDFFRRTPEEIELDEMGLPDPRDLTEEEYQEYITSFEEAEREELEVEEEDEDYLEEYDDADNSSDEEWKDA